MAQLLTTSTLSLVRGTYYASPIYIPQAPRTVREVVIDVDTALATATARVGLYRSDELLRPTEKLWDAGTFSLAATGLVRNTVSETLPRGLSWAVVQRDDVAGGPPILTSVENTDAGAWAILGYNATSLFAYLGWGKGGTAGPLPDRLPDVTDSEGGETPVVWFSFK